MVDHAHSTSENGGLAPEASDPNDAFAAYGRTMAYIGMIEQIMRLALASQDLEKGARAGSNEEKRQRFRAGLLRKDFGQLLQLVVDKFALPKHWLATLKEAKVLRDNLAHNFWVHHIGYVRTEKGLSIITRHCEGSARHMELVAHDLLAELNVDLGDYIRFVEEQAHNPEIISDWEELLDANEAALRKDEADRGLTR